MGKFNRKINEKPDFVIRNCTPDLIKKRRISDVLGPVHTSFFIVLRPQGNRKQ